MLRRRRCRRHPPRTTRRQHRRHPCFNKSASSSSSSTLILPLLLECPRHHPYFLVVVQCLGIVEHIKCCSGFRVTIHVPARDVGARLQVPIDRIYHRVDSIVGFLSGCLPRPLVVVPTLSSLNASVPLHPRPPCIRPRLCHRLLVFLAVMV